jgi:hypothetical protein
MTFLLCDIVVGLRRSPEPKTVPLRVNLDFVAVIEPDPEDPRFTILRLAPNSGHKDLYLNLPFEEVDKLVAELV